MIKLENISLQRGLKVLLDQVDLTLLGGQKIGFIGKNGVGKSSLFALLLGNITPDDGSVVIPKHLKIAHLAQEVPALQQVAIEYVIDGDHELRQLQNALDTAEDGMHIAEICSQLETIDAYTVESRAAQLLHGLGFTPDEQKKFVSEFSGGWRMRLNLARTLMSRSDILLLDEPTNHLDLDAIIWLEEFLKTYQGTLILISHDRDFIDGVATHIIHLENQKIKSYTGNYSAFEKQRAEHLSLQQASYEKQQEQRAHLQKFIDRFRAKASKATQAQSRIKALARMDIIQAVHAESPFQFTFREAPLCSNPLLKLEHANIGYDSKIILKNVSVNLTNDARIGLIGPNGAGKSTLIKCLAAEIQPLNGELFLNNSLRIGYFAQHQVDNLDLNASPLLHLQRISPEATEQQLRTYLGSFAFSRNQALNSIQDFSGGEKARLALAILIWQKPNLLLLDEPTNHLDLEVREALTLALQEYQGAMIIVSHDRHLLRSCTDELILVAHHRVEDFDGDLDSYEQWLKEYRRDTFISAADAKKTSNNQQHKNQRATEQKIIKAEQALAEIQQQILSVENTLADNDLYTDANQEKLRVLLKEKETLDRKKIVLEEEWLALQ